MRVLTCNIRLDNIAVDQDNQWAYRKDCCRDAIRSVEAHIISAQEVGRAQFLDLKAGLPEYEWFGLVDTVERRAPMNSIFFRRESFERISAGAYWLSETPHVPGSKSWDSNCTRLANWVRLLDVESGIELRVVNTHLDHVSQSARENQARLINEDAAAYPDDYPQILTGDMNAAGDNPVIGLFKEAGWRDTYEAIHGPGDPGTTFHRFLGPDLDTKGAKLDWIFTKGRIKALGAEILREPRDGRFPSDHYFVSADVELLE